jgi:hypothetical protein
LLKPGWGPVRVEHGRGQQPPEDNGADAHGGSAALVNEFLQHPGLEARTVVLGEDATPPGHQSF